MTLYDWLAKYSHLLTPQAERELWLTFDDGVDAAKREAYWEGYDQAEAESMSRRY